MSRLFAAKELSTRALCQYSRHFTNGKVIFNKATPTTSSTTNATTTHIPDVAGLSAMVVNVPQSPVGPGAARDSAYKNPEYFCYHQASYYDAEIEMAKFRCPQPSTKTPTTN